MSFSPAPLLELRDYWEAHGGAFLGIVGDSSHTSGYHLGKDRIYDGSSGPGLGDKDYSVQTARDKAGLTNAAAAMDIGKLNGTYKELRLFSSWLAGHCMMGATDQIREIIYSPDGVNVQRWDHEDNKIHSGPGNGDSSHLTHTHISFYRDTQSMAKTAIFAPYFGESMGLTINLDITHDPNPYDALVTAKVKTDGTRKMFDVATGTESVIKNGLNLNVCARGTWYDDPSNAGGTTAIVCFNYGSPGKQTIMRLSAVDWVQMTAPDCPPTDCSAEVAAAVEKQKTEDEAACKAQTDALDSQIGDLSNEVKDLNGQIEQLNLDLSDAEKANDALTTRMGNVEAELEKDHAVIALDILKGGS